MLSRKTAARLILSLSINQLFATTDLAQKDAEIEQSLYTPVKETYSAVLFKEVKQKKKVGESCAQSCGAMTVTTTEKTASDELTQTQAALDKKKAVGQNDDAFKVKSAGSTKTKKTTRKTRVLRRYKRPVITNAQYADDDAFRFRVDDSSRTYRVKTVSPSNEDSFRFSVVEQEPTETRYVLKRKVTRRSNLRNRIDSAFNERQQYVEYDDLGVDTVRTSLAATEKSTIKLDQTGLNSFNDADATKIIPYLGASRYDGSNVDGFESNVNVGLNIEHMINSRFSIGGGIGYQTMDVNDRNTVSTGITFSTNSTVDEISYKKFDASLNSKFFILPYSRVKPFIGASVNWNRSDLQYETRSTQVISGSTTTNTNLSEVDNDNFSGTAILGSEIYITRNFSMSVDLRYSVPLTDGFQRTNTLNGTVTQSQYDQANLNNIGADLEEANVASLNFGLVFKF